MIHADWYSGQPYKAITDAKEDPSSVTRWLDYLFNIWSFTTMKISPIAFKIC